ncbi:membrane protein YqaA, SNARE-associated domain [Candidatus Kryptobacter tengchongensis]|uniref:YqaA family protein n=1 Tax=Kryptobacter tengchongensis TaxID=1643429 RepID=UPI00070782A5|nr:YqaA family protein [Candidatus Kryptobacter tengchongensis]CUS88653.1 membrane protein YqaA, SNARE-associated domain [Candidatus Kryptobacter tengchongensis]CUS96456.1 membrane protein YqaA, SNARE-associated domain [Candidatus Kryptobacter tengchongensis]CUU06505.1 membrane protein YqaA, SNARE-associated domain [Candidatus Kryptobacter tengchongensis]
MMRRISKFLFELKKWVENFADKPYAGLALFLIAFTESSFFPIPPDVLLIAIALLKPQLSFRYALICSAGSVLGGMFGYLLGLQFYEIIGKKIIEFYHLQDEYNTVKIMYDKNAFVAIVIAGFTPIPYKVFTIAAGAFQINFYTLVLASALSRPARFFLVGGLIYFFGPKVKTFIDKYFDWLTIAFITLLILGFTLIKYLK